MTTNNTKENNSCIKCEVSNVGLFMCHGCRKSFCWKHIEEHKSELSLQMDIVAQEHDLLREDLNKLSTHHSLFAEIDQWENESIIKIRTVADKARRDVEKQIEDLKDTMQMSCVKIIDEIRSSQKSDHFISEVNIIKWTKTLENMRQQLNTTMTIRLLNDEEMMPIQMIKIKQETTTVVLNKPNFKRKLSSVTVDNLLKFIESTLSNLTLEQYNYIIDLVEELWDCYIEGVTMQLKYIALLGTIGQHCHHNLTARVLEILWNLAHDDRISEGILQCIFNYHYRIFNQGLLPRDGLKREYCLKCLVHLQQKQGWIIPTILYLIKILGSAHTDAGERSNLDIISLHVDKNNLIDILIENISFYQLGIHNKIESHIKYVMLIHGRETYEEAIRIHLNLLSIILKKGHLYLIHKCCEKLWNMLISNEQTNSIEHELGFDWFINCHKDLDHKAQIDLFENHVSKLDLTKLSVKGHECFKLYFNQNDKKST
ncbi:hypothetical protein I4U23_016545 [Adineta vaga]|nr:hypothetical protein I4U23_016545 [Adineta vaga]